MKSTGYEISTHHNGNSVYILFIACEINWISCRGWSEIKGLSKETKYKSFIFVYTCADVFFHTVSCRVVFTWYFIIRNEISFLSKWLQWNNTSNEFHFRWYHVNSLKKFTRHQDQKCHFARNEISCKHPISCFFIKI